MTQRTTEHKVGIQTKYFIDTNVWVYLFYPKSNSVTTKIAQQYADLFAKITAKGNLIFTNLIQFSELINVIINTEFYHAKRINKFNGSPKDFRKTPEFKTALKTAKLISEKVLKQTTLQSGTFNDNEMKEIVAACDKADFNDLYFVAFAEQKNLEIITHDFDFNAVEEFSNSIITANNRYFGNRAS